MATEQHGRNATEQPRTTLGEARRPMPLMPEVAILTTFALIAAPVLLVAGTLAMAAKKRLSER